MPKVKIVLTYDTETQWIEDNSLGMVGCFSLSEEDLERLSLENNQPKSSNELSKLTKLRAMNISVEEIMELKEAGLLDE